VTNIEATHYPDTAALVKQLALLDARITRLVNGNSSKKGTSEGRNPIPMTAPPDKPHWCSTHAWTSTHTTAECRKPNPNHKQEWGPAELERYKSEQFAARKRETK
jgi:hypothetical protein